MGKTKRVCERELYERYDEYLNEILPPVKIGDLEYEPAKTWKAVDEIAYDQDFFAWLEMQRDDGVLEERDNEWFEEELNG